MQSSGDVKILLCLLCKRHLHHVVADLQILEKNIFLKTNSRKTNKFS